MKLRIWQQHKEGNRYNAEVKQLIDDKVHLTTEKFEDLSYRPHTGCDTYASIHPNLNTLTNLLKLKKL